MNMESNKDKLLSVSTMLQYFKIVFKHFEQVVNFLYPLLISKCWRSCRGHDHMVVGFTTTCAISDHHH
jgi:hypothetical protein